MIISEEIRQAMTEVRPWPIRYTIDDVEYLPDHENNKYELIGGELFVSHAPRWNHQITVSNIFFEIRLYLQRNPIGEVCPGPGVIFSREDAVIPDIVFATHETIATKVTGEDEKFPGKFNAAPELLIEVLSHGKRDAVRDRIRKREIYGRFGVKEYWIVNGMLNEIEVYRLRGETLELVGRFGLGDSIKTPLLPGFSLEVAKVLAF